MNKQYYQTRNAIYCHLRLAAGQRNSNVQLREGPYQNDNSIILQLRENK